VLRAGNAARQLQRQECDAPSGGRGAFQGRPAPRTGLQGPGGDDRRRLPGENGTRGVVPGLRSAWPATATAVQRGFEKIARERPRGKAHLEKRGL
jgi:hypothetical protein